MRDIDSEPRISRRTALTLIAGVGVGAEVLQTVSAAQASSAGPVRESADAPPTIMLIRHAERPVSSAAPFGIKANGTQDIASLTVQGWTRAGALVELFDPTGGNLRPGIVRPTALFAAIPTASSMRPLETITPLAQRLRKSVNTPVQPTATAQIAHILATAPGIRLAAWQHQFIPTIARQLGKVDPTPPKAWPEDRFDIVWVFTRGKRGSWKFTQVPQLLLAGDRHGVIT